MFQMKTLDRNRAGTQSGSVSEILACAKISTIIIFGLATY